MEVINKKYHKKIDSPEKKYLNDHSCLLDIETTGFSRDYNQIYMIGLARMIDDSLDVTLLFAENPDEEKTVLEEFKKYSNDITDFITFNGLSFDFPFIKERMNHFGYEYDFKAYNHLDIYKECKYLKSLLKLNNLKQKTIESFLGLDRDDKYNGGELIEHYKIYCQCQDEECYNNLITHNLEDVKGMADILTILRYSSIYKNIEKADANELSLDKDNNILLTLSLNTSLPKRFSISGPYYYIVFENDKVNIELRPTTDTLRYYLNDYKNYVYIENENAIIPKQLLDSQNKKYATKATKENCFLSAEGTFLPAFNKKLFENEKLFTHSYNDKKCYIDISSHMEDIDYIRNYAINLIKHKI